MAWSGGTFTRWNGAFSGAGSWTKDRDAGTKITASHHDTNDDGLADGIDACIEKSGSNAFTGNANLGSQKITALADGTAHTDGINAGQIQDGGLVFQASDTGSADAYAIALTPAVTAYVAGQEFNFKAGATSTGASTLNVNGLGTKNIKKRNDQAIAAGDIEEDAIIKVLYDGTSFQMISQLGTSAGSMTSFTLTGDSGSNQTISDSNTMDIAGGTGIDTVVGATDTVTVSVDSTICKLNAANTWAAAQQGRTSTASVTGSTTLDFTYQNFILTATGNVTLANPSTEAAGQSGIITLIQDGTGSRTLSLGTDYETAGGSGLTISTGANAVDIIPYFVKASGSIQLGAPQLAFS
tara:strand:- start:2491 stop:3549 length:1059 start_codon:yes stop_codon:yes gene_type:complete